MAILCVHLTNCVDENADFTSIDFAPPKIVVEGVLIDGQPPKVWVGQTTSLLDDSITFRIPDDRVSVMILQDDQLLFSLSPTDETNIQQEAIPRTNRFFTLDTILSLQENSEYKISVMAEGLPDVVSEKLIYQNAFTPTSLGLLSDTSEINGGCRIVGASLNIDHVLDGQTYWVEFFDRLQPREERLNFGRELFLKASDQGESSRLTFSWENGGFPCTFDGTGLPFLVIATSEEYGDFIENRDQADFGLGGIFTPPVDLPQNIIGGYGYVSLGTSQVISF